MTVDETTAFLIRNATPDPYLPVTPPVEGDGDQESYIRQVLLRLSSPKRYRVPLEDFEAFTGEKYSFEKHLRAVHEAGGVHFQVAPPGSFYDAPSYREAFDHSTGLISDGSKRWLAFTIGKQDAAESAVGVYFQVLENLATLGVKVPKFRRKTV